MTHTGERADKALIGSCILNSFILVLKRKFMIKNYSVLFKLTLIG